MSSEKVKKIIINIYNKYKAITLMNIIIFGLLFFMLPVLMMYVNPILWRILFLLIIVGTTVTFYLLDEIKYDNVLISLPILFVFNLLILDYCTIRDLYGITATSIDKCPAILDALFIDMVIVFSEYISLFITRFIKNILIKKEKGKK